MRRFLSCVIVVFILCSPFNTMPFEAQNAVHQSWDAIEGDGTLRRIRVPILMYHYISVLPSDADAIRVGLTLSPTMFREHMDYLVDAGYETVSLYDLDSALEYGTALPDHPVVLTFDDGYDDHYDTVFPILRARGLSGTFFIISQFVDERTSGYMTWEQIGEMAAADMRMEAHTRTHSDLRGRDYDFLVYEIVGSLESVAAHSRQVSQMFSYPVGRYDAQTLQVAASAPIERAVTTQIGNSHTTTNRLELTRMRVTHDTGVPGLIYLLNYPD